MPFQRTRQPPQFADLKTTLAQTGDLDNSLYQVVQELIDRLSSFQFEVSGNIQGVTDGGGGGGGGTSGAPKFARYITHVDDSAALPNSRMELPGVGIVFDDSVANRRTIHSMNLDYLGDYTTGPTYVDGDIVIGPDGIAYLCVNTTNTPPVPWPGVGVSLNPIIDATYWTSTPHAQFVNERAMNQLSNGYVINVGGDPVTVYPIPFSDTSGIIPDNRLSPNVALKNIDNNFVAQTLGSYSQIKGNNSALYFQDPSGPPDGKVWRFLQYSDGHTRFEALNDVMNTIMASYTFGRDGHLSSVAFNGDGAALTNLNASNITAGRVPSVNGGVPSGMVGMFTVACPPGWTRMGAYDGRFPRAMPSFGATGGTDTHSHAATGLVMPAHNHFSPATGTTNSPGNHQHNVPVNGTTGLDDGPHFVADAGSSGTTTKPHSHAVNIAAVSDPAGDHTHGVSVDIREEGGNPIQGNTALANHLPYFFDVVFCSKD